MNDIQGAAAPEFEHVVEAFAATAGETGGSALSIRIEGETVVDVWHGHASSSPERPWQQTTPAVIFSGTKGLVAILAARLVEAGALDLDAPVSRYWPEFAAAGKESITVRQVMSHRAGLAALRADVDLATALDWTPMTERLAAEEPLWEPGTQYGYHALTYGWLVGEIVRRITGTPVGRFFREEIAEPLSADAWIGIPADREPAVARLTRGGSMDAPPPGGMPELDPEQARWMGRTMTLGAAFPAELVVPGAGFDDPKVHEAEIPGAGGIGTAHALATIWSSTVTRTDGHRLLGEDVVTEMTRVQSEGEPVWWLPGPYPRWGTGFMIPSERRPFLSPESFGHDGAGGQVTFADRRHRVGFAYVTNLMELHSDDRGDAIVRALGDVLHRS
ncbi:MAG: beta-lactamase family protein [Microbacterium sp.]|uniref:serine hydrolase domain-containing protein n=1 Tax=Microbacterium sp. TaxID=51671 RepID=UPI001D826484|nr:serine hydrolase domain-containing protein [Microbacterium sp.]MBW8762464.1 beta-lactamase family protein [Microbacterium sp.]